MSENEENGPEKEEPSILKKLNIKRKPIDKVYSREIPAVTSAETPAEKHAETPAIKPAEEKLVKIQQEGDFKMVATCMQNLEDELEQELIAIGAKEIKKQKRAIEFVGDLELLYSANIWLRTALKVLKPLFHYQAKNDEELYSRAKNIAWEQVFSEDKTFSIDSAVHSEHFTHSQFASLRIKDAIVDRFREQQIKRPNVERYQPDIRIHLHINDTKVTLSLDSSGDPLFKRGYRTKQHLAPINECLAAGLILKTGWKGECDFLDPMTGTGTIAIEASLIACNIPPNLNRTHFAFEGWKSYDQALLSKVLGAAKDKFTPLTSKIFAREMNSNNVRSARININTANMRKSISLEQADFFKEEPPSDKGIMVVNPPYGERLIIEEGIPDFFERFGSALKHEYTGWTAWIIAADMESFKNIGLKPSKKIPMMNGKIECQFRKYELFDGKLKELKKALSEKKDAD